MKKSYDITITTGKENCPEWYWEKGLHDAQIIHKIFHTVGYSREAKGMNCVEIQLDACQAMFDTSVKAIKLYNCKELTPEINIENLWWVGDKLSLSNEKYVLEIDLRSPKKQCRYVVRFENCEVVR